MVFSPAPNAELSPAEIALRQRLSIGQHNLLDVPRPVHRGLAFAPGRVVSRVKINYGEAASDA
jgi:hypothetical protein